MISSTTEIKKAIYSRKVEDFLATYSKVLRVNSVSKITQFLKKIPTFSFCATLDNNEQRIDIENANTSPNHPFVPTFLVECVEILECNDTFMRTVGLYRISGDFKLLESLNFQVGIKIDKILNLS